MHFHVEAAPALRHRSQVDAVGQHLGHRHLRFNDRVACLVVHALNASAPAVEVAHDRACEFVWDGDLDRHDRFQQSRLRRFHRLLERDAARHLERQIVRVDIVIRPVIKRHSEVDDRKTGEVSARSRVFDSFFHGGNEVFWDRAAENVVHEFELSAARQTVPS